MRARTELWAHTVRESRVYAYGLCSPLAHMFDKQIGPSTFRETDLYEMSYEVLECKKVLFLK